MIGSLALYTAFAAALVAGWRFAALARGDKSALRPALRAYQVHTACLAVASLYLLDALVTRKFQFSYVFAHTDVSLPTHYLVSAFWAGQEGSLLLWALLGAGVAGLVIRHEQKLMPFLMPTILAAQGFLVLFLMVLSPFKQLGFVPENGQGLNPMLLDPWMVIHPPLTFLAYALLVVPFAFAVAALWKQDYHDGFLRIIPWALVGWLFMGAGGIFVGGAWAYRVLGWGGYWGWDPVENAALLPWLTGAALVHGLLMQRQRRIFTRANLFLAITTYVLVVFATFLTRSGAMAEFSVHAFVDTPLTSLLGLFLAVLALGGYGMFAWRYRALAGQGQDEAFLSRPGTFGLAMLALGVSAFLVLLGTLLPLLTKAIGTPASPDQSFYWRTNAPVWLVLFLLLAVCPFLGNRPHKAQDLWNEHKLWGLVPLAATIAAYALGVRHPYDLVLLAAVFLALGTNLVALARYARRGLRYTGGYLAHVGLALMCVGIVASTSYTQSERLALVPGEPQTALGYQITYMGYSIAANKNILLIDVGSSRGSFVAQPRMYLAGSRLMREPYIARNLWRDLYMTPLELVDDDLGAWFILGKGESIDLEGYTIKFTEFTFTMPSGDDSVVEVGAVLEVTSGGHTEVLVPVVRQRGDEYEVISAELPDGQVIIIEAINAGSGQARFAVVTGTLQELLLLEVKVKPLISVLALGTVLLIAGTFIATWHRFLSRG
ncbi:MAG: cytochrome c biogenesis protein CcsA [Bacillota bacterium]